MSETTIQWILAGFGIWNVALSGALISVMLDNARMKSVMVSISKKAADMLHSPDDHFGIDKLLEKYIAHDHDLTLAEWQELFNKCDRIMDDKSISPGHRCLAMFVKELSTHKLRNKPNF